MLTPEETQRVQRKLDLNERLVWGGKPRPKGFNGTTAAMMLFGLPWVAITGFVSCGILSQLWAETSREPLTLRLFVTAFFIPFWAVGLSMLGAPLWFRLRQHRWLYAVTDKSALIVGPFKCARWRRREISPPDRADHRNGLTDLFFATASVAVNGRQSPTGFINLPTPEAPAAEQALRDLVAHD